MMIYQSSLPYSGLRWTRDIITRCKPGEEDGIDISHVICAKCNVNSKHTGCSLARHDSLVKCVNQRDTFPKDKCVDCGEPVHIGCSIVYPR